MERLCRVLTLVAEYRRVNCASLHHGFVDVIVGPDNDADHFAVRDANELHAGVEYVFSNSRMALALRLGLWLDPAHDVRFERSATRNPFFNELFSAALRGGESLVHVTGGTGLAMNRTSK